MSHFEPLRPNRGRQTPERYEFTHGKESLCVYDIRTLDFIKELPVGVKPDCHATTLTNRYLYLACVGGLYALDQDTLEICNILETGPVYATNALPDGETMLVHDERGGILVMKDIEDMRRVRVHKRLSLLPAKENERVELGGKGDFLADDRYYLYFKAASSDMAALTSPDRAL